MTVTRGMGARPTGGGRPQPPPRRATPQRSTRTARTGQQKPTQQKAAEHRTRAAQQQQFRVVEQQRQASLRAGQQHRVHQQLRDEVYTARRRAEAEERAAAVRDQVARLELILTTGLRRSAQIDLDSLPRTPPQRPFEPGPLATPLPEPMWEEHKPVPATFLSDLLWGGRGRRERQEAVARQAYEQAWEQWREAERQRNEQLAVAEQAHEARVAQERAAAERYNARIARVAAGLRERDPKVVESFLRTVLRRVPLPAGFPRGGQVTHLPAQEAVVVKVALPERGVVPTDSGYEYVASADEIRPVPRPESQIAALYRRALAQVALLVVRDVFEAEPHLSRVTLHGEVELADEARAAGTSLLLSLTIDRGTFAEVDLVREPPEECLQRLGAQLSADPYAQ